MEEEHVPHWPPVLWVMPRKELEDGHLESKLCFSKNSWEIGAGEKIGTISKMIPVLGNGGD